MADHTSNEVDVTVGSALRRLREAAAWTGERLAISIGVTATEMRDIETGRRRLRASEMMALAHSLKIQPADLYADLDVRSRSKIRDHRQG